MKSSVKNVVLTLGLTMSCLTFLNSQVRDPLTLEQCYQLVSQNHPLSNRYEILRTMEEVRIDNLSKDVQPSLGLVGQATYQTQVTELPIEVPGAEIPKISKDQYRLYAEIVQPLTEFNRTHKQQELVRVQSEIDQQKVSIQLYLLREKINELFFNVLLIDKRLDLIDLQTEDLQGGIERLKVALQNEVAIESDLDELYVRKIEVDQRKVNLQSQRSALLQTLGSFIGEHLEASTSLHIPDSLAVDPSIDHPELELYRRESEQITLEKELLEHRAKPHLGAFLQTGLGRPALNFLDPDLQPYALAGLRFNWNFDGLLKKKNDTHLLALKQRGVQVKKDLFLLNTKMRLDQYQEELANLKKLIKGDRAIISHRANLTTISKTQLENGIITGSEYVTQTIQEDRARQNLALREIEYLKIQYQIKVAAGH